MNDDCPMTFAKAYEELSLHLNGRSLAINLELWWYKDRRQDVPEIEYKAWVSDGKGLVADTIMATASRLDQLVKELLRQLNPEHVVGVSPLSEAENLISALNPGTDVARGETVSDVSSYNVVPTPDLGLVHILESGLPVCRFSNAAPHKWPQGNVWVSGENGLLDDLGLVNCVLCKREHTTLNP